MCSPFLRKYLYFFTLGALACTQLFPSIAVAEPMSTEDYKNDVAQPYIEAIRDNILPELRQQYEESSEDGFKPWGQGDPGLFKLGNWLLFDRPDPRELDDGVPNISVFDEIDYQWIQLAGTFMCNANDWPWTHLHSYEDLHSEPEIEWSGCKVEVRYRPPGLGYPIGECWMCFPIPYLCDCFEIYADVVDYAFPTQKISISNSPFYSRYLGLPEIVLPFMLMANLTIERHAMSWIQLIEVFFATVDLRIHDPSIVNPSDPGAVLDAIFPDMNFDDLLSFLPTTHMIHDGWQPDCENRDDGYCPRYDPLIGWMYGGIRSFQRLFKMYHVIEDREGFQPHFDKLTPPYFSEVGYYGEDAEQQILNPPMSFWLTQSKEFDEDSYEEFLQEPQRCVQNNMERGKTPDYAKKLDDRWFGLLGPRDFEPKLFNPTGDDFSNYDCVEQVGEAFPMTASTTLRDHVSDKNTIATARGFREYQGRYGTGVRYTFSRERYKDLFQFMPDLTPLVGGLLGPEMSNNRFREELGFLPLGIDQCSKWEDIPRANIDWGERGSEIGVNQRDIRVIGNHAETSQVLYTRFSGCWGFKTWFWYLIWRFPTTYFPILGSSLVPGSLRQE